VPCRWCTWGRSERYNLYSSRTLNCCCVAMIFVRQSRRQERRPKVDSCRVLNDLTRSVHHGIAPSHSVHGTTQRTRYVFAHARTCDWLIDWWMLAWWAELVIPSRYSVAISLSKSAMIDQWRHQVRWKPPTQKMRSILLIDGKCRCRTASPPRTVPTIPEHSWYSWETYTVSTWPLRWT